MTENPNNTYWKSPAPGEGGELPLLSADPHRAPAPFSRRRFLEAAGFTLSAVALNGCRKTPVEKALPLTRQPAGVVPGRSRYYASTCCGCSAACGLLVGVRDGRPLKMEGLPEHPLSRGGLCPVGQALPLELYDSHRLKNPLKDGAEADWKSIDRDISAALATLRRNGGAVRFLTGTVTSPALQAAIDRFLKPFDDARHIMWDVVSSSAILEAHQQTHGVRLLPHYRFDRAETIVSFGADFLGTWISPVEFTRDWRSRRVPTEKDRTMSHHVQLEGRLSLTGSNADVRHRLLPTEYGTVLTHLLGELARRAGQSLPLSPPAFCPLPKERIAELAAKLWNTRGRSLVISDSQDRAVQVLCNYANHLLGNYGKTVDIARPSRQRQGNDRALQHLLDELHAGRVAALFVAGIDPLHSLPHSEQLAAAVRKIPLSVSFAQRKDDFAERARYVCPDHHSLESWGDAEPVDGLVTLLQPTIRPLGKTRPVLESLAKWSGRSGSAQELVRAVWREQILPRQNKTQDFIRFWDQSLRDGFAEVMPRSMAIRPFDVSAVKSALQTVAAASARANGAAEHPGRQSAAGHFPQKERSPQTHRSPQAGQPSPEEFTLLLYTKVALPEPRHAENPWLQELPDPVSKVTWDNYASVSATTAQKLKLQNGDVLRLQTPEGTALELPAFIQPGQHEGAVCVALNYGVKGTARFEKIGPPWIEARPTTGENGLVGVNAAPLLEWQNGLLQFVRRGVTLSKTGRHHPLASTQEHHFIEVPSNVAPRGAARRDIIQETTLAAFRKNPQSGKPLTHETEKADLWPADHPPGEHHWGMVIDLNACTGCSACVIACQSENNVPVVGRDEVRRQREMHWIRLDRYYSGKGDDVQVAHQPMMCHHCDNAPCETVCPVLATVHSEEGLNQQAYNRCVGTRYCANNCPYKVRRFNWFNYPHDDLLQNLALNPDVTVRSRGVMEKCSLCVQRIQDGKLEARREGQPLADGAIQTACQQSCPAQAIVFGDTNDPQSEISKLLKDPRRYSVLEELNIRPSVSYLRLVRHRPEEPSR